MPEKLTILYNSVCPVCREGICSFERRTKANKLGVDYIDISVEPKRFEAIGITLDNVRFKLHALTPNEQVLRGWPAVAALWDVTPGFEALARIGRLPAINPISTALYDATARILWIVNRLQKRW
ncbi:MAG: DCC1-like thiol-disulfide oxidoreductase family protein [Pseudomonadota bacterium]